MEWKMSKIKKVVFLDYDGTLNDVKYLTSFHSKPGTHSGKDSLDPKKISLLRNLCSMTGAKVVLTSSWRDDLETRKYLIQKWGIPIIGATPHKYDNRDLEIHQWMIDNHFDQNTGQYIILDDESSEFNKTQRAHLIYTREAGEKYPILGLQPKHIDYALGMFSYKDVESIANDDFLNVILEGIESEWLRVMGNVYQKDMDDEDPWRNTGNVEGYKNDTFEVHAYDWGWDYDNDHTAQPINFKWRDLGITWYKYCGRGLWTNRRVTHNELAKMLDECLQSLRDWENENDR